MDRARVNVSATATILLDTPKEGLTLFNHHQHYLVNIKGIRSPQDINKAINLKGRMDSKIDDFKFFKNELHGMLGWVSIFWNVSISNIVIKSIDAYDEKLKKDVDLSMRFRGSPAPSNDSVDKFHLLIKKMEYHYPPEIELFLKAKTEDDRFVKFWYLYNILKIVTGRQHEDLDKFLKDEERFTIIIDDCNFPKEFKIKGLMSILELMCNIDSIYNNYNEALLEAIRKLNSNLEKICRNLIRQGINDIHGSHFLSPINLFNW